MDELKELENVRLIDSREEAERLRTFYDARKKVKTDVFRVKEWQGKFYIEQDLK